MARGFLNTEAEAWPRASGGPTTRVVSSTCSEQHVPQSAWRQQGNNVSFLPHHRAIPQELRELGPLSTGAPHPMHVPIWVSPGLRSKMDLLFAWPHPLESERPHCGMRLGRICKEGGRGGRRSSSCPEWPLAVCVLLGITSSLWGLGFPSYKLFPLKPAPLPSFPSREQPDLFFNSYPGSLAIPLILSHVTSAYTPNAVCH